MNIKHDEVGYFWVVIYPDNFTQPVTDIYARRNAQEMLMDGRRQAYNYYDIAGIFKEEKSAIEFATKLLKE